MKTPIVNNLIKKEKTYEIPISKTESAEIESYSYLGALLLFLGCEEIEDLTTLGDYGGKIYDVFLWEEFPEQRLRANASEDKKSFIVTNGPNGFSIQEWIDLSES